MSTHFRFNGHTAFIRICTEETHFDWIETQDLVFFAGQTPNIKVANFMCCLQVAQLHHELNLKDELLQFYTNAAEESEDESSSSPTWAFISPSPSRSISLNLAAHSRLSLCFSVPMNRKTKVEAATGGFVSDTLQRKLKDLEEENLSLRSEVIPANTVEGGEVVGSIQ